MGKIIVSKVYFQEPRKRPYLSFECDGENKVTQKPQQTEKVNEIEYSDVFEFVQLQPLSIKLMDEDSDGADRFVGCTDEITATTGPISANINSEAGELVGKVILEIEQEEKIISEKAVTPKIKTNS